MQQLLKTLPPKTHLLAFGGSSVWDGIPNANGTQTKEGEAESSESRH